MNKPLISVILPNYNHGSFLVDRLESIFNQSFQEFEVILLDDASTDHSVDILKKYAKHPKVTSFIVNEENSGKPLAQWKKGLDVANGEFIWIAESDDSCESDFLKKIFDFIRKSETDLGVIYVQSEDVDFRGNSISNRIKYTSEFQPNIWKQDFILSGQDFVKKYLKVKNVIPNASGVVFKKKLVEDNILKEITDMYICGDWMFWIEIISKTNIAFISETLNFFRDHSGISRNHNTIKKKQDRLLEEARIRRALAARGILQVEEIKKLYEQWSHLHSSIDILNTNLLKILVKPSDYLKFYKKFFMTKFNV